LEKHIKSHLVFEWKGKEEIINDIENRIAELFSEKLKAGTSVFISEQAVAGIIASIGRPEEFDADNIELGSTVYSSTTSNQEKSSSASGTGFESRGSLYRNENDKV
jgi:hypothetical protein